MSHAKNAVKKVRTLLLDFFFGVYIVFLAKKIIWERLLFPLEQNNLNPGHLEGALFHETMTIVLAGCFLGLLLFLSKVASPGLALQNLGNPIPENDIKHGQSPWKNPLRWVVITILILTFVSGYEIAQVSMVEFFSQKGFQGVIRIFSQMAHPEFKIFVPAMKAALETIFMALMATSFAIPLAFVLSFFAARNLMIQHPVLRTVYYLTRFFLNLTRSVEPLIWAIVFSVWVGIGPFAGMLALMLHSIASLAKLYSEQIENINDGPLEAMIATGASPVQVVWFGVVPQITLPFLSFTIYRWDINVRMATVIGLVGGGGLGTLLIQYQMLARWSEVGLIVMVIAVIVWIMDYASAKIREAIK